MAEQVWSHEDWRVYQAGETVGERLSRLEHQTDELQARVDAVASKMAVNSGQSAREVFDALGRISASRVSPPAVPKVKKAEKGWDMHTVVNCDLCGYELRATAAVFEDAPVDPRPFCTTTHRDLRLQGDLRAEREARAALGVTLSPEQERLLADAQRREEQMYVDRITEDAVDGLINRHDSPNEDLLQLLPMARYDQFHSADGKMMRRCVSCRHEAHRVGCCLNLGSDNDCDCGVPIDLPF